MTDLMIVMAQRKEEEKGQATNKQFSPGYCFVHKRLLLLVGSRSLLLAEKREKEKKKRSVFEWNPLAPRLITDQQQR